MAPPRWATSISTPIEDVRRATELMMRQRYDRPSTTVVPSRGWLVDLFQRLIRAGVIVMTEERRTLARCTDYTVRCKICEGTAALRWEDRHAVSGPPNYHLQMLSNYLGCLEIHGHDARYGYLSIVGLRLMDDADWLVCRDAAMEERPGVIEEVTGVGWSQEAICRMLFDTPRRGAVTGYAPLKDHALLAGNIYSEWRAWVACDAMSRHVLERHLGRRPAPPEDETGKRVIKWDIEPVSSNPVIRGIHQMIYERDLRTPKVFR